MKESARGGQGGPEGKEDQGSSCAGGEVLIQSTRTRTTVVNIGFIIIIITSTVTERDRVPSSYSDRDTRGTGTGELIICIALIPVSSL